MNLLVLLPGSESRSEESLSRPTGLYAESMVQRLLSRVNDAYEAQSQKRWPDLCLATYECSHAGREERVAILTQLRRLAKRHDLVEWSAHRVVQCGSLAGVLMTTVERWKDAGGKWSTMSEKSFSYWTWREGEWFWGGDQEADIYPDLDTGQIWLTPAVRRCDEIWVAPNETPFDPAVGPPKELSLWVERHGAEAKYRDEEGPLLLAIEDTPARKELKAAVCLYTHAVMEGRRDDVGRYWSEAEPKRSETRDEIFETVNAAAKSRSLGGSWRATVSAMDSPPLARSELVFMRSASVDSQVRQEQITVSGYWLLEGNAWRRTAAKPRAWNEEQAMFVTTCAASDFRNIIATPGAHQETP